MDQLTFSFPAPAPLARTDARERLLVEALKKCRSLTRFQETSPETVRAVGIMVGDVVRVALLATALEADARDALLARIDKLERGLERSVAGVVLAESRVERLRKVAHAASRHKDYVDAISTAEPGLRSVQRDTTIRNHTSIWNALDALESGDL